MAKDSKIVQEQYLSTCPKERKESQKPLLSWERSLRITLSHMPLTLYSTMIPDYLKSVVFSETLVAAPTVEEPDI